MNKTVNINLAGIFFHIDENAYAKLQGYLERIKQSFTDSQGRSEILLDIEARIAELFNERIKSKKQVISIKEVEEVINIMGQPEDFIVDEEIFEDEPQSQHTSQSYRKLFRDAENAYIGGVSSGLSHYLNIDTLWIRLIWVCLFFLGGTGPFIYILLWILMPAAKSTADKLSMSGKPVNITNIEQKVKEGFSSVKDSIEDAANKVKKGDYNKIKSLSRSFFDALINVIMFCFSIGIKFAGIILIIVGASTLIALFLSLLSVSTSSFFNPWWMDYLGVTNITGSPIWLISVLVFFILGVPFFFIFLIGLKLLVNNLKPIGKVANITMAVLWLVAFLGLCSLAIAEITEYAVDANVVKRTELNIKNTDTLKIRMLSNDLFYKSRNYHRSNDFKIVHDKNDNKKIYSSYVRLIVKSTKNEMASISIQKKAEGRNYQGAKKHAKKIEYHYTFNANELLLDSYLLTDFKNKYRNQEIEIILYLPEGSIFYADKNTYSFHRNRTNYNDILKNGMEAHYLKVIEDDVICLDCTDEEEGKVIINLHDDTNHLKIDRDGISAEDEDVTVKINSKGIEIKSKK